MRHIGSVLLALLLLAPMASLAAPARPANDVLRMAVLSDLHLYPYALTGGFCKEFLSHYTGALKPAPQSEGLLNAALATLKARAKTEKLDVLLLAGDLTCDGEYQGHQALARALANFERETGVQVAVIPGNHDINNPIALDYSTGVQQKGKMTTPTDFATLYQSFGYDLPNLVRFSPNDDRGGGLSYAVDLAPNFRLIALDTLKYAKAFGGKAQTSGQISPGLLRFATKQIQAARAAGQSVFVMGHHNLVEHWGYEASLLPAFVLDDFRLTGAALADAGAQMYLDGHIHVGEIGEVISPKGAHMFDVSAPALTQFPSEIRRIDAKRLQQGQQLQYTVRSVAPDEAAPVVINGQTQPQPYYKTNFNTSLGNGTNAGIAGLFSTLIKKRLSSLLRQVDAAGGLLAYLQRNGTDVAGLQPYKTLFKFFDYRYVRDPAHSVAFLNQIAKQALALPVSPTACDSYQDLLGLQVPPGQTATLQDFLQHGAAMLYLRDKTIAQVPLVDAVLQRIADGSFVDQLIDFGIEKLLQDVAVGEFMPYLPLVGVNDLKQLRPMVRGGLALLLDEETRQRLSTSLHWLLQTLLTDPPMQGAGSVNDRAATLLWRGATAQPQSPERLPLNVQFAQNGDELLVSWQTLRGIDGSSLRLLDPANVAIKTTVLPNKNSVTPFRPLDLRFAQLWAEPLPTTQHTVRVHALPPGNAPLSFALGDAALGLVATHVFAPPPATPTFASQLFSFFDSLLAWLRKIWFATQQASAK